MLKKITAIIAAAVIAAAVIPTTAAAPVPAEENAAYMLNKADTDRALLVKVTKLDKEFNLAVVSTASGETFLLNSSFESFIYGLEVGQTIRVFTYSGVVYDAEYFF